MMIAPVLAPRRPPIALDNARRQRCEVWTRVMGYHRPVASFNPGKQAEHQERVFFNEPSPQRHNERHG